MIYYAAFPVELAFEGYETFAPEYRGLPFARGCIIVEALSPTSFRIVGLISSEIQDYLQPQFQPGRIIDLYSNSSG